MSRHGEGGDLFSDINNPFFEDSSRPDSSSRNRLLEAIRSEVEKKGEELRKFREVLDSFREIVPEADKRFDAAVKALSSAGGLSREDIVRAADRQLAELNAQKEKFSQTVAKRREELKPLAERSRGIKGDIAILKEKIRKLEEEEKDVLKHLASGEKDIKAALDTFASFARDVEQEILDIKGRLTGQIPEAVPAPAAEGEFDTFAGVFEDEPSSGEDTPVSESFDMGSEMVNPMTRQTSDNARICRNCKNRMDWYDMSKKWICFACGHEEA